MKEYKEIFKLKDLLDKENIKYLFFDRSDDLIKHYQLVINKDGKRLISVVEGDYTYGGENDLLEIMDCLTKLESKYDSVMGSLTAEEVFNRIKINLLEGENNG